MPTFTVGSGVEKYITDLSKLMTNARPGIKHCVYVGASIVKKAIEEEMDALPTGKKKDGMITPAEKRGLIKGFGISKMDSSVHSGVNVKFGFASYNDQITQRYPQGEPNCLVARSIISGASFRKKNDFIGRAVRRSKDEAERAMAAAFDEFYKNANY